MGEKNILYHCRVQNHFYTFAGGEIVMKTGQIGTCLVAINVPIAKGTKLV